MIRSPWDASRLPSRVHADAHGATNLCLRPQRARRASSDLDTGGRMMLRSRAAPCGLLRSVSALPAVPIPANNSRTPANTAPATHSVFAAFRWYSRQFADLRNIGANG